MMRAKVPDREPFPWHSGQMLCGSITGPPKHVAEPETFVVVLVSYVLLWSREPVEITVGVALRRVLPACQIVKLHLHIARVTPGRPGGVVSAADEERNPAHRL